MKIILLSYATYFDKFECDFFICKTFLPQSSINNNLNIFIGEWISEFNR